MSPGDGAVTSLALYAPPDASITGGRAPPTHMLSGAADGAVTIWTAGGDWTELKTVADHGGAITGLTVHDSGRVFVSTDVKGGLRLWSLVKGKAQFKTRLLTPADAAAFGPSGAEDAYALLCGDSVTVHSVGGGDGGVAAVTTLTGAGKQLCATWLDAHTLATGGDKGTIALWDVRAGGGPAALMHGAHSARVKGIALLPATTTPTLSSAGGDGCVRLWDWRAGASAPPLASASASGARLTCAAAVAAVAPSRAGVKKTPQEKSRRAKREAAAAAAAAPQAPPPTSPAPAARPEVKLPNAKARRKLLRAQVAAAGKDAAADAGAPPPPPKQRPGGAPASAPAGKFAGANEKKRGVAKREEKAKQKKLKA